MTADLLARPGGSAGPSLIDRFGRTTFLVTEMVLIVAVWEVAFGVLELVNPALFPPPSAIFGALVELSVEGSLLPNLAYSARSWVFGYTIALSVGVGLGLMMGTFRPVGRLLGPLAWALYAAPIIAIRPMTTIWFGFGAAPIVFLVFLTGLFPVMLNTAVGVRTVDRSLLRAGRVFGGRTVSLYLKVRLPWTLPYIFAGMRLAIPASIIGLLIGELLGSPRGLGALISIATSRFRADQSLAVIFILVLISVTLIRVAEGIERKVSAWR